MSIELLSNSPWLSQLSSTQRQQLLAKVHIKQFVANQTLLRKSSSADGLYGVIEGELKVNATTFNGEEIVFTKLQPGDWFGEIAILDGGERTHDAFTTTSTSIAVLPKHEILQICEKNPQVYTALVQLLCLHCRQAFNAIDDFLLFSPKQRIAKRILMSTSSHDKKILEINQSDLGALVGISRQSTNKILRDWEHQGWIQRRYGRLEILNREQIENLITA